MSRNIAILSALAELTIAVLAIFFQPLQSSVDRRDLIGITSKQISTLATDLGKQYSEKSCFDYSTHDEIYSLSLNNVKFSKGSNAEIYVYRDNDTNIDAVTQVHEVRTGTQINFSEYDHTSRVYSIRLEEYFIARNNLRYFLLGLILPIKDDTRGDDADEVYFAYRIDTTRSGSFAAM